MHIGPAQEAVLQQTPSTLKVLEHWSPEAAVSPRPFFGLHLASVSQ
ncbi:MAG: hypothetical protein KA712_13160 [Myxococcales bacterium]|nr:hypothetical protein [Myxococcales bacterium]